MNIAIDRFGGIVPRLSPHQLPPNGAGIAHDVQLRNGRIEAWREPCEYATAKSNTVSFHVHGCCILEWAYQTSVAELSPEQGRFFVSSETGTDEKGPWVVETSSCTPTHYYLGVPAPDNPLSATGQGECDRDLDVRSYVYTFMNKWGEESAPSPPSALIQVKDDANVALSGFSSPPVGYAITHINIYRSASGFVIEDGKAQTSVSEFLYVGTIEAPASSYTDMVRGANLGPAIETEKVCTPPEALQNLVAIEGTLRLAGTKYNRVYMSENMEPYNWPIKYELTLDDNIIHMKSIGKRLYVTTDTKPYVVDTSQCGETVCYNVVEGNLPYPDIACKYSDATVVTPYGLAYVTPVGIGVLKADATVDIVTKEWFGENDWAQIKPDTARLGYWQGFLFLVTDEVSFIFNIGRNLYGNVTGTELTTISDKPIAMQSSSTGKLFYLENGKVKIWNQGTKLRPYIWESRRLTGKHDDAGTGNAYGTLWSPSSARIGGRGAVGFTLTTRHGTVFTRDIPADRVFRLPRVGRHSWYTVRLEGTSAVEYLDLGTAHWTVNMGA